MKKLVLFLLFAVCLLSAAAHQARAVYVLTVAQQGDEVDLSGSGNFDLLSLIYAGNSAPNGVYVPGIDPGYAIADVGVAASVDLYNGAKGPASFGPTIAFVAAGSATGSLVGIDGMDSQLRLPTGYVSGTALAQTAVITNATFASLGLKPGTYTYTWGSGTHADSFVFRAVPEPCTWALLGVGAAGAGVVALRRRQLPKKPC